MSSPISQKKSITEYARKVWHWFWHDDSVLSWVVQMLVAFILIKYLLYPGLGIIFHTGFPIVAVVSGSMEHRIVPSDELAIPNICGKAYNQKEMHLNLDEYWDHCGKWYEDIGINKSDFTNYLFKDGFNKGDIIFIYGTEPKNLKIGDTIVFSTNSRPYPIIHRIVQKEHANGQYYFTTKGDHNGNIGPFDLEIPEQKVLGKAVLIVPWLGYAKIWFTDLINLIKK